MIRERRGRPTGPILLTMARAERKPHGAGAPGGAPVPCGSAVWRGGYPALWHLVQPATSLVLKAFCPS